MGRTKRPGGSAEQELRAQLGEFVGQADEATFAVCRTGEGLPKATSGPLRDDVWQASRGIWKRA